MLSMRDSLPLYISKRLKKYNANKKENWKSKQNQSYNKQKTRRHISLKRIFR